MTNEFWLNDFGSSFWIETGFIDSGLDPVGPWMFWAQQKPGEVATIATARHVGLVLESDGPSARFAVVRRPDGDFEIYVDTLRVTYRATAENPMWDDLANPYGWVAMGMELAGTSGAAVPIIFFYGNKYASLTPQVVAYMPSTWNRDASQDPHPSQDRPPFADWLSSPAGDSNAGGLFYTQCCMPLEPEATSSMGITGIRLPLDSPPQSQLMPPPLLDEELFDRAPTALEGVPAVEVTQPGEIPGFSAEDLAGWMRDTSMVQPYTGAVTSNPVVACPITALEADRLLPEPTGLLPDRVVCLATADGTFTVTGPPDESGRTTMVSTSRAFVVVDAASGNMLISGTHGDAG